MFDYLDYLITEVYKGGVMLPQQMVDLFDPL